jgi:hypothetical protein
MWIASITAITNDPDAVVARVTFLYNHTDGRQKTITERVSEPGSLKEIARNALIELARQDAIAALIQTPTLGTIDFSVPAADPDITDYQTKLTKTQYMKGLYDLGVVVKGDFDAKVAELKTAYDKVKTKV